MKTRIKRLWNNRVFRTFLQTTFATIFTYFASSNIFNINDKELMALLISAIATGLSAIMPLFNEKEEE